MTMMGNKMTLDEALEHHGVKGQKWGVTRKPTSSDIHDSRARVQSQVRQLNNQVDRTNLAQPGKHQLREAQKLQKMHVDLLNNPDRATALRMTKGEKWVAGIVAVALPGPGTVGVGLGVGIRVAARHHIEKQQNNERRNNG